MAIGSTELLVIGLVVCLCLGAVAVVAGVAVWLSQSGRSQSEQGRE